MQLLKRLSAKVDVKTFGRSGTNITTTNSSRLNLDQHVAVADWWNGDIANLHGQRLQENAGLVCRNRHRFLGVYSGCGSTEGGEL